MNKVTTTKRVNLNVGEINDLIKNLKQLSKDIDNLPEKISKEVAELGYDYLVEQYAQRKSDPNIEFITPLVEKTTNGYRILAVGRDVAYEEFGTGDEGERVANGKGVQEARSKIPELNDYNSGRYIRSVNPDNEFLQERGIVSGKYWTYKRGGIVYATQGVKPGLEMFNTAKFLKDKGINQIVKKKVSDVLSKV